MPEICALFAVRELPSAEHTTVQFYAAMNIGISKILQNSTRWQNFVAPLHMQPPVELCLFNFQESYIQLQYCKQSTDSTKLIIVIRFDNPVKQSSSYPRIV